MMRTRRQLNACAAMFGIKRKWFGLESNGSLRRRILDEMQEY